VQVDYARRLRFKYWADGISNANRSLYLSSDISLVPVYVMQYKLTLASPFPTLGGGWYDEGSAVTFSDVSISRVPFIPISFDGWYDETGNLNTPSPTGS